MQPGDFCIVRGVGIASDLVEEVTRSPWTHIISAIDTNHYLDPVWPLIDERAGVFAEDSCHFIVSVKGLDDDDRRVIHDYLRGEVGKHYSLKAFVWAGMCSVFPPLRRVWDPMTYAGVVCSTSLAWAFFKAGKLPLLTKGRVNWTPEAVTPAMLAEIWGAPGTGPKSVKITKP